MVLSSGWKEMVVDLTTFLCREPAYEELVIYLEATFICRARFLGTNLGLNWYARACFQAIWSPGPSVQ